MSLLDDKGNAPAPETQNKGIFSAKEDGLVPAPGSISKRCLRDDGTWQSCDCCEVPDGTGFVHITGGVQDANAKLVVNADVSVTAAIAENKLALNYSTHSNANDPTSGEKDALVGTDGTPSSSNPYVTDSDPRLAAVGLVDGDYGDIIVSGSGTSMLLDNSVVIFTSIQDVNSNVLIGRDSSGTGPVEEITIGGGLEFTGSAGIQRSALTGDVTASAGSSSTTIPNDTVTFAKMQNISANRIVGATSAGDPVELAISTILDWISTTRGSILYRGASGWAALPPNTAGYVLKDGGSGADPSWSSVASLTGLTPIYDAEGKVSGPSYHSVSTEFFADQTAGGFTNAFNPGSVSGLSQVVSANGLSIVLPATGGATARLTGYYSSTFPSNDFSVLTCIDLEASGNPNSSGGLMLLQGTGSTDDVQIFGFRNGSALNVPRVGLFSAYNTFSSDAYLAGSGLSGKWFVGIRYSVSTKAVTCWMGPSPDSLSIVDTRTLTNSATLLGFGGQGVNGGGSNSATLGIRFIRVCEESYSATVPPTKMSGVRKLVS